MCCEYPNISFEILPEHRTRINIDGWEPKQYTAAYAVENDGKITLLLGSENSFPDDDFNGLYVVRDESNISLTHSARPGAASPVSQGRWPLVFIPGGDWRPAPTKP